MLACSPLDELFFAELPFYKNPKDLVKTVTLAMTSATSGKRG